MICISDVCTQMELHTILLRKKRFFGRGSEYFFKRPVIEARWDDTVKDDRGNFYFSSSRAPAADNLNTIYFYNIGMRRSTGGELDLVSSEAKFLKNLSEYSSKDLFPDTEYLLKNHMAMLQHKIAKNKFLLEAAKLADSGTHLDDMFKTQRPGANDKKKANFQHYTFVEDGKEKPIWVEGRIANLLEKQDIFSDQSSRHWLGWASGAHAI